MPSLDRWSGEEAAERARVLEEFHQRRREAAANRMRGQAQWLPSSPSPPPPPPPHPISQGRGEMYSKPVTKYMTCRRKGEASGPSACGW